MAYRAHLSVVTGPMRPVIRCRLHACKAAEGDSALSRPIDVCHECARRGRVVAGWRGILL